MSADPRTHESDNAVSGPSSASSTTPPPPPSVNGNSNGPSRPPSTSASSSSRIPSTGSGPRDINALRAAALKSSRMKKLKAEAQQRKPSTPSREEGEISDGSEEDAASGSATPAPQPEAPAPGIVRQTVVTLSPNQENDPSQSTMTKEEETQYLSTLRNLMEELGVPPQDLVSNGAPFRLVTQACQEIVATSKRQAASRDKASELWTKTRSPRREASETPGLPDAESRPSTRTHSRMSSPEVEVTVHTSAMSPGSDSSTEAIVERMVPRQNDETSYRLPPASAAVHIDTYRPLPRTAAPPRQPPVPPSFHPPPMAHPALMAQPARPRRRRRDLDSAAAGPTTLNYGDDSDGSKSPSPPPQQPPAPPPPPPAQSPSQSPPPPPAPVTAPVPAPKAESLAETRRRLLASRGKRKPGTPTPLSGASSSAPTPPLPAPPVKTPETAGSNVEVPMDIDEEVEDGEIQEEEESETLEAPRFPSAEPVSRTSSRGLKRPHAEDLMDLPTRPTSAARLAPPRRRIFGTLQWSTRLQMSLDDSEEDDSSDEECDDEPCPPVPVIEIPPEWEVVQRQDEQARLIAEKEEHIRRLKEKIQALAAKKRGAMVSTPSGTLTPSTEAKVAEAAEAAVAAMEGDQQSVLEAAAMAINDDRSSWAADGKSDAEDGTMDVDEDESSSDPDTAAAASSSVCGVRHTELSEKHHFQPYRPLLTHYPQLVPCASAAGAATSAATDDGELTLDWGLLSSVILTHRLQRDPDATMCAFEAGGGRCTDVKCDDVHLVRAEPTDEDMVAYISQILAFDGDGDDSPSTTVVAEALNAAKKELDTAQEKRSRATSEAAEGPLAQLLASATRRLRAQLQAQV